MDPWRLTTRAQRRINALAGLALASCVFAWLAGFGSASTEHIAASIENAGAKSIVARHEPSLIESTEPAVIPQATVVANAAIGDVETVTAAEAAPEKAADTTASLDEPKPFVVASLTDSSQVFPPEEVTTAPDTALPAVSTIEINEECLVAEICIDRYLWALYERAPKIDAIKVHERRKVTIRRKGKTVTVTRTFTRRVDEEFGWKDPKAAEKVGMTMMDYVIGGMDRTFKIKLFHTLHAAEQAGLQPGITSAFRDDYRQSIATGLKAATDRSYHGGSTRGGYGRGLAADIVSVKGATRGQRWVSTEKLWKWIDERGKEFGIGRPYLDRDPPHVAPIDGREYASRRGGAKTQAAEATPKTHVAEAKIKKGKRLAARGDHSAAKRARNVKLSKGARTAKLSKGRTM
jgi:hypothetical protein